MNDFRFDGGVTFGLRPMKTLAASAACAFVAMMGSALADDFPGAGHKFVADFAKFKFEHAYSQDLSLTYTALKADGVRGECATVKVRAQELAPSVFMVSWQEDNKTTVVQVQDYARKIIYANLTLANGAFIQLQGTFTPAD